MPVARALSLEFPLKAPDSAAGGFALVKFRPLGHELLGFITVVPFGNVSPIWGPVVLSLSREHRRDEFVRTREPLSHVRTTRPRHRSRAWCSMNGSIPRRSETRTAQPRPPPACVTVLKRRCSVVARSLANALLRVLTLTPKVWAISVMRTLTQWRRLFRRQVLR